MAKPQKGYETVSLDGFEELSTGAPTRNRSWSADVSYAPWWVPPGITTELSPIYRAALYASQRASALLCRSYAETFWLKQRFIERDFAGVDLFDRCPEVAFRT